MKIRIEVDDTLPDVEVIIRCAHLDDNVRRLQQAVQQQAGAVPAIVFYKDTQEFYFPLADVLFFETEGEVVYAHTASDAYRVKFRLYELEQLLPRAFVRVSKSTIVNVKKIYSIRRDLSASSQVEFFGTHKRVFASRRYYPALKNRMREE